MDTQIASFRADLDARPMSRFQLRLLVLAVLLMLLDGYDTYAIGSVVPALTGAWHIMPSSIGPVFSAGLFGLTIGALIFGPAADRLGARRVLLGCTAAYAVLTLATALVPSQGALLGARFLTGLELGGAMPCIIALVSEYAQSRVRNLMVAATVCGFALGGAVSGLVAAATIARFGWQSVFIVGGIPPLLALPLLARWLPESLPRLLADPAPQTELRRVIAQVAPGWEPPAAAAVAAWQRSHFPVRQLFASGYALPTVLIWVVFICNLLLLYFLASWIPPVVHASGQSVEVPNLTVAIYQGGGTIGALALALLCDRLGRSQLILAGAFVGAAAFCALIGNDGSEPTLLMASAAGAGFCVVGGQIAANAFVGNYYPAAIRATGIGWALGVGRFGSILGPLIGGILIGLQVTSATLFGLATLPALLAATCILLVRRAPDDGGQPFLSPGKMLVGSAK